ncbi:MotA/TolQ/ExbB proton channel family protein [Terrarubrum flagellatum]|uniref:MotA/TolQ/ExbB proton channel family protein n=1 Tax=Terrirubrum flagellatum TaxID=2895980 RepID=UPI003144E83E
MAVFVILAAFVGLILQRPIVSAFLYNPGLNGLIAAVLLIGIILAVRQTVRLFREVRWVNSLRRASDSDRQPKPPVLLAPMMALLGDAAGRTPISTGTLRAVLDSLEARLDEGRDILRYLTGLLVFLGLLGTFWGLIDTVGSIGKVIASMRTGGEAGALFDELKTGLASPLGGMGISFSSSLFGLAGSLILGFLDLQAGQAQNRFANELEEWLARSAVDSTPRTSEPTVIAGVTAPAFAAAVPQGMADLKPTLDRLQATLADLSTSRSATQALANLAEGIQGLVHHMRNEQQMIRDWVDAQAEQQRDMKALLERLAREHQRS